MVGKEPVPDALFLEAKNVLGLILQELLLILSKLRKTDFVVRALRVEENTHLVVSGSLDRHMSLVLSKSVHVDHFEVVQVRSIGSDLKERVYIGISDVYRSVRVDLRLYRNWAVVYAKDGGL